MEEKIKLDECVENLENVKNTLIKLKTLDNIKGAKIKEYLIFSADELIKIKDELNNLKAFLK